MGVKAAYLLGLLIIAGCQHYFLNIFSANTLEKNRGLSVDAFGAMIILMNTNNSHPARRLVCINPADVYTWCYYMGA